MKKKNYNFDADKGPHKRFMPDIEEVIVAESSNREKLEKGVDDAMIKRNFVPLIPLFYDKASKAFIQVLARFREMINIL
jgi:hypothetical protein